MQFYQKRRFSRWQCSSCRKKCFKFSSTQCLRQRSSYRFTFFCPPHQMGRNTWSPHCQDQAGHIVGTKCQLAGQREAPLGHQPTGWLSFFRRSAARGRRFCSDLLSPRSTLGTDFNSSYPNSSLTSNFDALATTWKLQVCGRKLM